MLDNKYKYCVGITLYNPDKLDIKNIEFYADIFECIYVYDNTETNIDYSFSKTNINIVSKGHNDGLGVAFSKICKIAQRENFDFILLLDQDSRINYENIMNMINYIENEKQNIVLFCPQIVINNSKKKTCKAEYIEWCITSGSFLRLNKYGVNYVFDEKYFIDRLDKDLCKQIILSGNKICRVNDVLLYQKLGDEYKMGYSTHGELRHYYIARNRRYYNSKYKEKKLVNLAQEVKHVVMIILHEKHKVKKLKMFKKGIMDFKEGKNGKYTG